MTDSKPPGNRDEQQDKKWYDKTRYQLLLSVAVIALFVIVAALGLDRYIDPRTSTEKKDLVQALGLITAGLAGAFGIFFTWRGQRLAREAQENNQRNTQEQLSLAREAQENNQRDTQEQLRLTRQSQEDHQRNTQKQLEQSRNELDITRRGQMTERFTQAIAQLGSEKLEIELGGIYSLERTAQEEKDYHWPVMEVLTSYVRRHAPRNLDVESTEEAPPPKPDIQAILDVIGRRSEYHRTDKEVEYGTIELNLTALHYAYLQEAYLRGADLRGADLRGASLKGANLHEADLRGADLRGADLKEAILRRADLKEVDLRGADLKEANLRGADLKGADLHEADLHEADLHEADLRDAYLQEAYLQEAYLQGADLRDADLRGASLKGANLKGANLLRAKVTDQQLDNARYLQGATMPDGSEHT